MGIKVLSLFDGISCGMIALERTGIEVDKYYASEIDKYAIQVSQNNYPNITRLGDIRNINTSRLKDIDLLIGGSPCQNMSFAGRQQGMVTKENVEITTLEKYLEYKNKGFEFEGQSYLFWEYVRILNEIKPKYFLLENVNMSKKWEKVITQTLSVEPISINSNLVSAQNRPRLYWTNIPNVTQPRDKCLLLRDILDDTYTEKEILSQKIQDRFQRIENSSYAIGTTRPEFRTIGQRDYVFGDNNKMGCLTATDYKQPKQVYHNGVLRKISPIEAERLQTLPDRYTDGLSHTKRFQVIGNGWTVDIIAHIFKGLKEKVEEDEFAWIKDI